MRSSARAEPRVTATNMSQISRTLTIQTPYSTSAVGEAAESAAARET